MTSADQIKDKYTIIVASTNKLKLQAAGDCLREYFIHFPERKTIYAVEVEVYGQDCPSGVSEQPINGETAVGCRNRLEKLKSETSQFHWDMLVAFENGIYFDEDTWTEDQVPRDHCHVEIYVKLADGNVVQKSALSKQFTTFPPSFLTESLASNQEITVGKLIEKEHKLPPNSWHEHFDKKIPRVIIMKETLRDALDGLNL